MFSSRIRRHSVAVAAVIAVVFGFAVVPATSASAATAPKAAAKTTTALTISTLPTKTAPYNGTATVTPSVKSSGNVSVSSKTLTVKRGSKTVAKNKPSVKLSAGTYKVTQTVKYRTYSTKTTTKTTKKKVVGVKAYTDVNVTCVASKVALDASDDVVWGADVAATCSSTAFDGPVTFVGYLYADDESWWGLDYATSDDITTHVAPSPGARFAAVLNPGRDLMKTVTVTSKVNTKVYSSTKTKTKAQTLLIKQGKKPTRVVGNGGYDCPKGYPIKGNADSGIYHVPSGAYYSRTKPEECFATEGAAVNAGYRKSKR